MISDPIQSHERTLGDCYRLLAACFYPPQRGLWLEENLPGNLALLLEHVCPPAAAHARAMQAALSHQDAEELLVEYARLFVGPQRVIAAPYGSVYLEEGRRVMGDSTLDALQTYQDVGLHLEPDVKDLPDHIAVELEFVYYLTNRGATADGHEETSNLFATRAAFLDRHLRHWVPTFSARIIEGTTNPFYRALAECLKAFIANPSHQGFVGRP